MARWILIAGAVLAVTAIIGFQFFKPVLVEQAFKRGVANNVGVDRSAELPDGLHVYMCGTGSPMADPDRAGPCIGVLAGRRAFIFDVGSGGVRNLGRMGFPMPLLERVYLTHLHSDHFDGLGELTVQAWVVGTRKEPLPLAGPPGVEEVADGLNAAYRIDGTYRTAHHGETVAAPSGRGLTAEPIVFPVGPSTAMTVLDEGDLKITVFKVSHAPVEPAYGYRVDYKGRSAAFSGDTIYAPSLVAASEDVDVLFHEAIQPDMIAVMREAAAGRRQDNLVKVLDDILDYHPTPSDAARAARESGAGGLIYYHTIPPIPADALNAMFIGDATSEYDGPMTIAKDGLLVSLPAGSDAVEQSNVLR